MADILLLKNDVLNELRNRKYYVQKELERVVITDRDVSHEETVTTVVDLVGEIGKLENSIKLVEVIFATPQPKAPAYTPESNGDQVPTNVVEAPQQPAVNEQGQSHSE